jgi:cytochrome c-type biogenesis protein CcmH
LFLIARSAESREILAVRKEVGAEFPFSFHLSAADAMTEGTSFSGTLEITARLSKTGEAMPNPGDLEGIARNVPASARGVAITLDTVRK